MKASRHAETLKAARRGTTDRAGDLPLVLFTSFAMLGAGSIGALPLVWIVDGGVWWPGDAVAMVAISLLGCGLLLSLTHLGRKGRLLLVIRGFPRSPLSLEVVLTSVTIAALSGVVIFDSRAASLLWSIAVSGSWLLLVAIGLVYRLKGQVTWGGISIVAPLTTGLLWGLLLHAVFATIPVEEFHLIVYLFIAIDSVVMMIRWNMIERRGSTGEARNQNAFRRRGTLLILRLTFVDLAGVIAYMLAGPVAALVTVTFGVFIDRYSFYALGVQLTTEAEVARIESMIREGTGE